MATQAATVSRERPDARRGAEPKRITHVITRFIRGGADENTLYTCNGQAAMGHDVELIAGDHHRDMVAALDPRVRWTHLPSLRHQPSPSDVACMLELRRHFRRTRPDLVHTHESKAGILGRVAARWSGVPTIIHGVHILPFVGVAAPLSNIYLTFEKMAAKCTDGYVSVSDELRRICLANQLGGEDNHIVAPSGMDIVRFRAAAPIARDALVPGVAIGEQTVIGLIAAALEPRKRVVELVRAVAASAGERDWALLVAGDGPERGQLEALIRSAGLADRVFLLGFRPDLDRLMASADVLIHGSVNEGLPRVVVQAVLTGLPVVCTALPGVDRVIAQDGNGWLVASVDAVADGFVRLVDDPGTRRRLAAGAAAIDLDAWNIASMVETIQALYDQVDEARAA